MGVVGERIGVFGGTFDPPHNGHVAIVEFILSSELAGRVLVVPTGQPWLRASRPVATAADRLAMARLAFDGVDGAAVLDIETKRPGVTYTVDTVAELGRLEGPSAEFVLILGMDSARSIGEWHEHKRLLSMCELLVIGRPGTAGPGTLRDDHPARRAQYVEGPMMDISATEMRQRLASGRGAQGLVPPAVAEYVREHGLYGASDGSKREASG